MVGVGEFRWFPHVLKAKHEESIHNRCQLGGSHWENGWDFREKTDQYLVTTCKKPKKTVEGLKREQES